MSDDAGPLTSCPFHEKLANKLYDLTHTPGYDEEVMAVLLWHDVIQPELRAKVKAELDAVTRVLNAEATELQTEMRDLRRQLQEADDVIEELKEELRALDA